MFTDYTNEILRFYQEKKAKNELSVYLQHPTPANLKRQWLLRYNDPCNRTDQYMLQSFIGRSHNERLHVSAIRMYDTQKLKPLSLFLNKKIKSTSEKNIELLAYLLDFQIRPYNDYHRKKVDQKEKGQNRQLELREQFSTQIVNYSMPEKPKSNIIIEYPSGIKVYLDVSNVEYINQLVNI